MDDINNTQIENPGLQLSSIRQQRGYTLEYVANKLHLRTRIIELIENGDFDLLPEPVFIRGYLRAYAKLLGVSPEPFLAIYNSQFSVEKKPERALWQSKRESRKAEHFIRWFTMAFAAGVLVAVGLWWQNNRDTQSEYSTAAPTEEAKSTLSLKENPIKTTEIKLSDISKMQALLNPDPEMSIMEKQVD
jgi:cytoskeleton protein RodZ